MTKILVIGGTHGNELLGVKLVELLVKKPIENVDTLIANPRAVAAGSRFIESDINRSFGVQRMATYETARAAQIQKITAGYDVVLDFHNTQTPGNNCCFVGDACLPALYGVAKTLGLRECIEATYDCINKYCPNTLSVEISIGDALDDPMVWWEKIAMLASAQELAGGTPLTLYRFDRRVTWEQKQALGIDGWQPFVPIERAEGAQLGVEGLRVPIFIGSRLTPFYATLLTRERQV